VTAVTVMISDRATGTVTATVTVTVTVAGGCGGLSHSGTLSAAAAAAPGVTHRRLRPRLRVCGTCSGVRTRFDVRVTATVTRPGRAAAEH
jgi:phage shock protein PspC (stress-responsive transcriptional regulator)